MSIIRFIQLLALTLTILSFQHVFPKRAIVVGASSGIGESLVKKLSAEGYEVGLVARRVEKMNEIVGGLQTKCFVKKIDISKTRLARTRFNQLLHEMKDVELIVINSGVGNEDFEEL